MNEISAYGLPASITDRSALNAIREASAPRTTLYGAISRRIVAVSERSAISPRTAIPASRQHPTLWIASARNPMVISNSPFVRPRSGR